MTRSRGLEKLFKGRHFDREIIVLCVRAHLRFNRSFRDLVERQDRVPATATSGESCNLH
jgi:hypothetical protein